MMNLKLQKAAQRHFVFVDCYVVKLRCVTFSNVLYVFGLFMNNQLGHVYISASLRGRRLKGKGKGVRT